MLFYDIYICDIYFILYIYIYIVLQVNEVVLAIFLDIHITKSHEILYADEGF